MVFILIGAARLVGVAIFLLRRYMTGGYVAAVQP